MTMVPHHRSAARGLAGALLAATLLAVAGPAAAQSPSPELPQPPAAVIHCVRPFRESIIPDLVAPERFAVTLDTSIGKARLSIQGFPEETTCWAVYRNPRDGNPMAQEWSEDGVADPGELIDEGGFASAGRYCYTLIIGSPRGRSEGVERCIDVPESVAPLPTPTPTMGATPPPPGGGFSPPTPGPDEETTPTPTPQGAPRPPDAGTGAGTGASAVPGWWLGGGLSIAAAAAFALRMRRRPRAR